MQPDSHFEKGGCFLFEGANYENQTTNIPIDPRGCVAPHLIGPIKLTENLSARRNAKCKKEQPNERRIDHWKDPKNPQLA